MNVFRERYKHNSMFSNTSLRNWVVKVGKTTEEKLMKAIARYPTQHLKSWLHDQQVDFDNELIEEAMIFLIPHTTTVKFDDAKSFSFLKTASGRFMDANVGIRIPDLTSVNFKQYFRYEVFTDVVDLGRSTV